MLKLNLRNKKARVKIVHYRLQTTRLVIFGYLKIKLVGLI